MQTKIELEIQDLVARMIMATAAYDEGMPLYTDAEFDAMEKRLWHLDPGHSYFKQVGSDVRGGKVKLPVPMSGLTQVHVGDLEKWKWTFSNTSKEKFVVTEKIDGTSALVIYDHGKFQQAFSRGDGTFGADITRHFNRMSAFPKKIPFEGKIIIRGEVVVYEEDFQKINATYEDKWSNARNFCAGQMNKEVAVPEFYEAMKFYAYTVVEPDIWTKIHQLDTLCAEFRFTVPSAWTFMTDDLNEKLLRVLIETAKEVKPYAIDGLVVSANALNVDIKYKIQSADNVVTVKVLDIEWKTSRLGQIKPVVILEPTPLGGVVIQRTTGFHGKYIMENGIGPGAEVVITRSGDVIPYILAVNKMAEPKMPSIEWEWDDTETNCIALVHTLQEDVGGLEHFFKTMKIDNAGEGVCKIILEEDPNNDIESLITLWTLQDWINLIGKNGMKIHASLMKTLQNVDLCTLADASGCYPLGVGERKLRSIQDHFGTFFVGSVEELCSVSGIEEKTANKILNGNENFHVFLENIKGHYKLKKQPKMTSTNLQGTTWNMTGFRNADMEAAIIAAGGKIGTGKALTHLVAKDPHSGSGKILQAQKNGAKILSITEAMQMLGL